MVRIFILTVPQKSGDVTITSMNDLKIIAQSCLFYDLGNKLLDDYRLKPYYIGYIR